jgi:hypothetical protein
MDAQLFAYFYRLFNLYLMAISSLIYLHSTPHASDVYDPDPAVPVHFASVADRGRDVPFGTPPAQIRTGPIKASGSYRGCLTRKRSSGHGWRTVGIGRYLAATIFIRRQSSLLRWLRRARLRYHRTLTW